METRNAFQEKIPTLNIYLGRDEDTVEDVDIYFDNIYEESWFEDELVSKMIKAVDGSEFKTTECVINPRAGVTSVREISGGVKALILMLKTEDKILATNCGQNCNKWILEIAKRKNLTISLCHYIQFEQPFRARIMNTGVIVNNQKELDMEEIRFDNQS